MPKQKEPVMKKQSGVRLDPELIKSLKHLAIDLDKSFNSLVEEAIEDLLKKYSSKK
jgi:predicted transcriptional regulator